MKIIENFIKRLRKKIQIVARNEQRRRLISNLAPDVVYAIGDIHGCYDLLIALEKIILADACQTPGKKLLVFLGDYVDRGSKSAAVVDYLVRQRQDDFYCICLAGNHEEVMLDFLKDPSLNHPWLKHGGFETLQSYGIYEFPRNRKKLKILIDSHIPNEHIIFLKSLPSLFYYPDFCFVHAGIEDGVSLAKQKETTLLWKRAQAPSETSKNTFTVVHGHTAVEQVCCSPGFINVDTGAYKSGVLSAIKISANGNLQILNARL